MEEPGFRKRAGGVFFFALVACECCFCFLLRLVCLASDADHFPFGAMEDPGCRKRAGWFVLFARVAREGTF